MPPAAQPIGFGTWRSKHDDLPVQPTGEEWKGPDGRVYARVRTPDGAEHCAPKEEFVPARGESDDADAEAPAESSSEDVADGSSSNDGDPKKVTTAGTPNETDDEVIARLVKMSPLEYDRARDAEAKRMGCRTTILDMVVAAARGDGAGNGKQGQGLQLKSPEVWPESVNGAVLLTSLAAFVARYLFLPPKAVDAIAVWVLHTHMFACFRHTPRLAFTSPLKRCGKTTALDVLALLVCKPLATANITTAALFRTIEMAAPSLLIDEADTFLRDNEELRGAINAGHKRGGQVIRCVGDDAEPRAFGVFAPCAIAAIGRLPGTIEDRSIPIRMQRATPNERPAMLDEDAERDGKDLARRCARWADDHRAGLRETRPELPPELFNRAADNWRPLFAIAEAAGGDWPTRIAVAVVALAPDEDESRGVRLLADIKSVFDGSDLDKDSPKPVDAISSVLLSKRLVAILTSPWAEYGKNRKPITQRQLARVLLPFRITPGNIRLVSGKVAKGYRRDAFLDAWARYLDDQATASGAPGVPYPLNRYSPTGSDLLAGHDPLHPRPLVADRNVPNPASEAVGSGLTDEEPPPPDFAGDEADGVAL